MVIVDKWNLQSETPNHGHKSEEGNGQIMEFFTGKNSGLTDCGLNGGMVAHRNSTVYWYDKL